MKQSLTAYIETYKTKVSLEMERLVNQLDIPEQLKSAMRYSLEAGGKRLRPVLVFASHAAYSDQDSRVLSTAAALEMIHTYSLIHDDLPAMDDDDYRRGKLTNHKVYGEATAILAGDALLTYAFELLAADPLLQDREKVELVNRLSKASGPKGMVAGQLLDMEAEQQPVTLEELEQIHIHKTGALLEFAVWAGAYLGGASESELTHLQIFSRYLGLIFQVQDDLLDEIGDPEKLGKPVGSDLANEKSTYPKLLGLEGAEAQKMRYVEKAKSALAEANAADSHLMALTELISRRDH